MSDLTALQKSDDNGSLGKAILSSLMSTQAMTSSSSSTYSASMPFDFTASPLHKSLLSLPSPVTSHLDIITPSNIEDITRCAAEVERRRAQEKPYSCSLCSKRYVNSAGLITHMLAHKQEKQFTCATCQQPFASRQQLQQHAAIHKPQQQNACPVCFKSFSYKSGLAHHMQEHDERRQYTCGVCNKVFSTRSNLNAHILSHTYDEKMRILGTDSPPVSEGNDASRNSGSSHMTESPARDMGMHTLSQSGQSMIDPLSSGFRFALGNTSVDESMNANPFPVNRPPMFDTNRLPFPGFDATRFMMTQQQRMNMLNSPATQSKERQFVTPTDSNRVHIIEPHINITDSPSTNEGSPPNQNEHLLSMSADPVREEVVNVCDSTTDVGGGSGGVSFNNNPAFDPTRMRMEGHVMEDGKERPYTCTYCTRRFTQRQALRVHEMAHTGDKPHECQICHKRFAQKAGLDQHQVTHTGERPHACPLCAKKFTQKANLNHHLLTHSGERKFACRLCGRRFTQKANLQTHILTHTGVKPHACPMCDKRFTQKGGLIQHMQTHTAPTQVGIQSPNISQS